ncbi:Deoxyribodipyrimidine photo-lyase-related protein [Posidoniimonas corsicana]|uniref:Deoxyribodipyrimidine photo-lyase-related protein n=1 Tax=Posidoniimonas corsicana TaxID=1938618 RepID=A0A5C5VJR7_9BACT|nr:cryptochrome/photolyase family protein [Posidoniimonas corsicana]TWT38055.1 Deoxyribodipyrimidine photo-lyase-related protein [Posidoniimonas corsicana]
MSQLKQETPVRHLVIVLGDQLNADSASFDGFDNDRDLVLMIEADEESTHVWSTKPRIAVFLAAMRHFRDALRDNGRRVSYRALEESPEGGSLSQGLAEAIAEHSPERLIVVHPGEYRVLHALRTQAGKLGVPLDVRADRHFLSTPEEFAEHASGRKQLRMEYFYREMRKRHGVLMEDGEPAGGDWNYDKENRGSFSKRGPRDLPAPHRFRADKVTKQVLELVNDRFGQHPGELDTFDWPVTAKEAKVALRDFIKHRLSDFGEYQDAMWTDEPWLYHSRISAAMNLKLLDPRDAIGAAVQAYESGDAPLNSVEGFVRQILGWREYVRGVYWMHMPEYLNRNALHARAPLPDFYWTGETDMQCLRQAIGQTLRHGYAHHIQRLMVTGLYALLLGVDPKQVHEWYLAVYVDAVEWVELPNSLGMSQYADGGVMASKPYIASGKYIKRMSNYCQGCRFNPDVAVGEDACPFTTLYWDFLDRHQEKLSGNNRMRMQLKNLERKSSDELKEIRRQAEQLKGAVES